MTRQAIDEAGFAENEEERTDKHSNKDTVTYRVPGLLTSPTYITSAFLL